MTLLDTHVLIWLRLDSPELGKKARRAIDRDWQTGQIYVSAITFWEIAMLKYKGRLEFIRGQNVDAWHGEVLRQGLKEVPVTGQIGIKAAGLTDLPGDPADRIIAATAADGYQLITADKALLDWSDPLRRLDAKT